MSRRERILYDLDHIIDPWTKEGLDNYNNAMEKTDAEYEKVCQEIPDDIYDDEEDDDDDDYDYNEEDDDDDDDEYDYDYNEEDDDDDEYDYNEEDDDE
ncbi:MAG: hypothetical protein LBS60_11830 [Deltaproteobacteria bacterium]|nr:hypothetical protein [Deltaproteobacteria bacterium]